MVTMISIHRLNATITNIRITAPFINLIEILLVFALYMLSRINRIIHRWGELPVFAYFLGREGLVFLP